MKQPASPPEQADAGGQNEVLAFHAEGCHTGQFQKSDHLGEGSKHAGEPEGFPDRWDARTQEPPCF